MVNYPDQMFYIDQISAATNGDEVIATQHGASKDKETQMRSNKKVTKMANDPDLISHLFKFKFISNEKLTFKLNRILKK
jgi:hypothetical protein